MTMTAGEWLRKNDPKRKQKRNASDGPKGGYTRGRHPREILCGRKQLGTIKRFVENARWHKDDSKCLFVPGAVKGRPAKVTFCGKSIAAARYMLLLSEGTSKSDGMCVLHSCGNGHLSCVNPNHLRWGTPGDNLADSRKHKSAKSDDPLDKIESLNL